MQEQYTELLVGCEEGCRSQGAVRERDQGQMTEYRMGKCPCGGYVYGVTSQGTAHWAIPAICKDCKKMFNTDMVPMREQANA